MRFDWTITFGHLATFVAGLFAMIGLYIAFALQVGSVDARTLDYPQTHDRVIVDAVRIDALTTAIAAQTASNEAVMRSLNALREDVAAIRGALASRVGP